MGYAVRIGGTPNAPGNVYDSATALRYGKGISRAGMAQFTLIGLNGQAEPAEGDYVEATYTPSGGSENSVWQGFVRQIEREENDIDRRLVCMDGAGEIQRRDFPARLSWTGQNQGTIASDILAQVGITTASSPIRHTGVGASLAAGAVLASWRAQYANAWDALRALAAVNGYEVTVRKTDVAGTKYLVVYFEQKRGDYAASQATWKAGVELGRAKRTTDNWEQSDNVTLLGQGDGTEAPTGTSAGAGNNRTALPAKHIDNSTVAGTMAQTLEDAFRDSRITLCCEVEKWNLEVDSGIDVGDRVTIQRYDGTTIGDFRIFYLECDPEYRDGWLNRVTLVRATTSGGAQYPALPNVVEPGGVLPDDMKHLELLVGEHQGYVQRSDLARIGASRYDNAATTGPTVTADGSGINRGLVAAVSSFDVGSDEGLFLYIEAQCTDAAGTIDIDVLLTPNVGSAQTIHQERVDTPGTSKVIKTIWIEAQALVDILGMSGTMQSVTLTVWNRSGANRTLFLKIGAHVVKKHYHN